MHTHTQTHMHTHRNCFPVVALGKLKLHYGPPEGSGERGIEEEVKRGEKRRERGEKEREKGQCPVFLSSGHHEDITVKQENSDAASNLPSFSHLFI